MQYGSSAPISSELFTHTCCQSLLFKTVTAVTGAKAEFQDAGLNFGLVQYGSQVTQQVTIQNSSLYAPAAWSLRELQPSGSHKQPADLNSTAQHAQHGAEAGTTDPADLNSTAQRAQQGDAAQPAGVPAALQLQAEQLLQQLHEGADAVQEAGAEAADSAASSPSSSQAAVVPNLTQQSQSSDAQTTNANAAVGSLEAQQVSVSESQLTDKSTEGVSGDEQSSWSQDESAQGRASNPFEGSEEEQEAIRLQFGEEWGVLEPGASRAIQVCISRPCKMQTD